MYISRIRLKNIRCIDDLEISLRSAAPTNDSLLLLGNNGVGKSTILRAVAIALCDWIGASGLVADMYGNLIKDGSREGMIEVDLTNGAREYQAVTRIVSSDEDASLERLERQPSSGFPWRELFLCGYGPTRVIQGTSPYSHYSTADAVYTLFSYGSPLQNAELAVRRAGLKAQRKLLDRLSRLLMMPPGSVTLSRRGLGVRNRLGRETTYGALADGHQSTMNWILDLVGWTILVDREKRRGVDRMEPRGIVLIDEIENHLHPTWQRYIFRLLAEQFPEVQFIATSHSPLPAGGIYEEREGVGRRTTSDQGTRPRIGKAHVLRMEEEGRVASEELPTLSGQTYHEIFESAAFSTEPRPLVLERAIQRVMDAYSGPESRKTAAFEKAMAHLRAVSPMEAASMGDKQVADELEAALDEAQRRKREKSSAKAD